MKNRRFIALALLFLFIGGSWAVVARHDEKGRPSALAIWELWTDVIRDADHFGLRLTRVSDAEEIALGDKIAHQIGFRAASDEKAQKYLEEVGGALTPHVRRKGIRYKFHLIDAPFVNAFAIPGGHIYVTTPMMSFIQTEAELAALLGHEIGHVDLRHCIEQFQYQLQLEKVTPGLISDMTSFVYRALTVGYSRQREQEADMNAVKFAAQAGYHPKHALSIDDRMADIQGAGGRRVPRRFITQELTAAIVAGIGDYLQSYPYWQDRIADQAKTIAKNEAEWRGKSFYVGRSNHADRVSRAVDDRPFEHALFEEPPGYRAYLAAGQEPPFRAFAAHLASGLSASVAEEASPASAIDRATQDCEKKMSPCALYALDDSLVIWLGPAQLEVEKAAYLKAVCASQPPERVRDACGAATAPEQPKPAAAAPLPSKATPTPWSRRK
jgi:Zn-dependent protease with chaperone function